MRLVPILALPLIGAACVPLAPVEPVYPVPEGEVRVISANASPERLVLQLSDRSRCVAERPEGETAGWSGVTSDCGYALPYTVMFRSGGNPARFIIEDPAFLPPGPEGGPGPRAEVIVTDLDGQRRLFVTPLGDRVRFEPAAPAAPAS
jgi:hypothetical protein